ncbi:MAG: sigma-70 family RNA polymerase sigma factor [Armatimonadetes bacterium]|nr:sigma-70 family RNA polymerase sigma factor [Armatimonadota bacterium]
MALAVVELEAGTTAARAEETPAALAPVDARTDARRRQSFETLVLPHLDTLRRGAWRLARDPLTAQDLVQEALLKAWRAFDTFRSGTNIRAWLLRILMNAYIDGYRKGRRQPGTTAEEHVDELYLYDHVADGENLRRAGDPADLVVEPMLDPEVEAAMRALPEAFRQAVILSDVEGLTTGEIARRLGVPVGTVMSRLHRARARLVLLLGDYARRQGYDVPAGGLCAGRQPAPAAPAPDPWAPVVDSGAA